jgi:branched-chain amino acid transport system substrate-binding protein
MKFPARHLWQTIGGIALKKVVGEPLDQLGEERTMPSERQMPPAAATGRRAAGSRPLRPRTRVAPYGLILGLLTFGGMAAAEEIAIGQLVAETGATAPVATIYGQGVADAIAFINAGGGVAGRTLRLETVDYGYDPARAMRIYEGWRETLRPVVIQGWGTADTEALVDAVARDETVFMSGSASAQLTDPTGRSPWTSVPAPYNFFYGPSYSDGCRALVQYAAEQWQRSPAAARTSTFLGDLNRPKFAFLGDNHPFPNAPRAACMEYARDLGFEIVPPIRYALTPGDFTAQCRALERSGADFAFLANTADANVRLVADCAALGVATQFLTNVYGWDEAAAARAGDAGNGMVWVVTVARWDEDAPGMATVREVSRQSDPAGTAQRSVHYIRGICSAFLMRDAIAAAAAGPLDGAAVKAAFEAMRDHVPAELEGVCLPSSWTPTDHRGTTTVKLYRSDHNFGAITASHVYTTTMPLRPDWLGW